MMNDFGVLFRNAEPIQFSSPANETTYTKSIEEGLKLKVAQSRRRMSEMEGKVAFYGATPHCQVYFNALAGAGDIACVFDDSPLNQGYSLYDQTRQVPVRSALKKDILDQDTIVITAYLHDTVIAKRLKDWKFKGQIFTIRPAPSEPDVPSI